MKSGTVVVLLGMGLLLGSVGNAGAAAAPSEQDKAYMAGNAQTSLAEITLAGIAMERASAEGSMHLAELTKADHEAALTKLRAVADKLGVTLPTEPSPAQKATAAKLESVPAADFDIQYAMAEVMGHETSLANTDVELKSGSDPDVLAYTQYYLPAVTKHLEHAKALLTELGGTVPSSVPAGSGGQGASTPGGTVATQAALVGAGVLLFGFGFLGLARRRRSVS